MQLTSSEVAICNGKQGEAARKAMEILVALGEIYGARRMVPIGSAHLAGVGYKTLGDYGLEFLEEFGAEGGRCLVPSSLNAPGVDVEHASAMGIPKELVSKQKRIFDAFMKLGVILTRTCTPYLVGNVPRPGEHVAWSESSAIAYVNSVLGARTNREGAVGALAAAAVGRTPECGYHLDENRVGTLAVELDKDVDVGAMDTVDYGVVGSHVGKIAVMRRPVFTNLPKKVSTPQLKMLGAALASYGSVALYHIVGVTPAAETLKEALGKDKPEEKISISRRDLEETRCKLCSASGSIDLVCVGCPHCTIQEVAEVASLLKGKRINSNTRFWVCAAEPIRVMAERVGYIRILEDAGVVVTDICAPMSPLNEAGVKVLATNSAKAVFYATGSSRVSVALGSVKQCCEAAVKGEW